MSRPLFVLALLLMAAPVEAQPLDGYHSFDALTTELRQMAASSSLARLSSIGETLEGREIWMMEIGNEAGTPVKDRPAVMVAANLEANQLVGSELSLAAMQYLLSSYGTDPEVTARLDEHVFYFLPRLNPDGAEGMFAGVQTGSATNTSDYDDDNDARMDEDGSDDLNGDGVITTMRVLDAKGAYMVDPDNPRLMKRADASKGETGTHALYWEGTDDDGDGFYNDDPAGGVDLNRNFQHEYPYYKAGSGIHMVSERESRAVLDFMVEHRNIAMVLVYGASDNLVTPPNDKGELAPAAGVNLWSWADASNDGAREVGIVSTTQVRFFGGGFGQSQAQTGRPSSGRRPATTVDRSDQAYYKVASDKYRELTGLESVGPVRKPEGALFQYAYYQYGVPAFSTPGWAPEAEADTSAAQDAPESTRGGAARRGGRGGGGGSVDATLLKWMDASDVDGFVDWTAHSHAQLGDVEIGGFKPYHATNPPAAVIAELGPKQGAFIAHLASLHARVQIAETEVIDEGGGIFRIRVEIENAGFLPTASAQGVRARSVRPTMVQLGIEPDDLLSGSAKTSFFQATDGSGRRQTFEWIIQGRRGSEIELRVVSQKGGSDTAMLRLQ